jgi:serine/threonine protein kinase
VHRDIKPANIILFGPCLDFKLADFGLSCPSQLRPHGFAGTPEYCSPLLKDYYNSRTTSRRPPSNPFKDEVYAVGVTANEVLRAIGYLWHQPNEDPALEHFNSIMEEMLRKDERDRPTFSDLMHSHFVHEELQDIQHTRDSQPIHKNILLQ